MIVTFFDHISARSKTEEDITLEALCERVKSTRAEYKDQLPWLKAAKFGNVPTKKGSLRHDANVLEVHGVKADYDAEEMPFDEAMNRLNQAGIKALVYTSASHEPDRPRWRVVAPFSARHEPKDRAKYLARLNGVLGGVIGDESFTLSQSYYFGHLVEAVEVRAEITDSSWCIDDLDELDRIACGKSGRAAKVKANGHTFEGVDLVEMGLRILSGESLHPSVGQLAGVYAGKGWPIETCIELVGACFAAAGAPRYTGRWDECIEFIEWVYAKEKSKMPQPAGALGEWDAGEDPGPIPPRQWLLGNQFCRGFISSLVAAGGVGKSALRLLQFMSLALDRPLCGQHIFRRCRVLVISLEDDRDELQRRIQAVLNHFGLERAELKGWLYCATPTGSKLAEMQNNKRVIGRLDQQMRDAIMRLQPDLVAIDPFVKLHDLAENDSADMNFVCDLLVRIAAETNIAVDIPHHVHKGQIAPGDADAGRGSSGIRDAGRLNFTLSPMSNDEAKQFGIEPDDRHDYVRLDSAKVNIARRGGPTTWFRIIGVPINNPTPDYPNGDSIQVVTPWAPPETWADTSKDGLNAILNDIARGMDNGQRYSNAPNAPKRAVWPVVQNHYPQKPEGDCRRIISAWLDSKLLYRKKYFDKVESKERTGLYVDDTKRPGTVTADEDF